VNRPLALLVLLCGAFIGGPAALLFGLAAVLLWVVG